MSEWKHPNDMSREELREVVSMQGWLCLDLAQHLNFLNLQFQPEGRKGPDDDDAEGYLAAERMAYAITRFATDGPDALDSSGVKRTPGIGFIDGKGGFSA